MHVDACFHFNVLARMCMCVYVCVCMCVCLCVVCVCMCLCLCVCVCVVCVCRETKRGRIPEHSSDVLMDEEGGGEGGKGNMSPLTQEQNIRIQQLKAQVNNVQCTYVQARTHMNGRLE